MKKILAVLLALSMLFAFAACKGDEAPADDTTAATESTTMEDIFGSDETDAPATDAADPSAADPSATDPSATDPSATDASAAESTTEAAKPLTKAEFVALYNAETAKIAKNGSYSLKRNCSYIKNIDVGGATGILNGIIKGIDENSDLNSVVGGFLDIGVKEGNVPKDELKDDFKLKGTTLKESDLKSFSASDDGVYTFTLAKATDPKKTGETALSRLTNDFITHEEVVEGLDKEAGGLVTLKQSTVNYDKITVTVKVVDGKITTVQYSYEFDAVLKLNMNITGTGSAKTVSQFTNIKY